MQEQPRGPGGAAGRVRCIAGKTAMKAGLRAGIGGARPEAGARLGSSCENDVNGKVGEKSAIGFVTGSPSR